MEEVLDFLRRLSDNNDREWFDAHRAEWTHVKGLWADFTAELIEGVASFDPSVRGLRPQDCTYRIARDTRFSADKRPYKSWLGTFIAPHGKKSGYAGYYFHVEPVGDGLLGNHLLAAGAVCIEPAVLRSIREEVLDHGDELTESIRRARGFRLDTTNRLKRVPTGFPAESEHADLLKQKDYCLEKRVSEEFVLSDGLPERLVEEFRHTKPFLDQLNRAIRYACEEM
ncbi:DUF2461 domain-containing protein [Alistipes sp. An66]|uniref:DUF2461 domain-containing protein n=1 Tax=Alistipes sp. An66 TaxID=1965650 RepID=UPI000B3A3364|nr:DUF2461 domain-containing protein [Alistipes sp. An66]OUN59420.1 TIGR02453 family protein [Alistipes sp. An66]